MEIEKEDITWIEKIQEKERHYIVNDSLHVPKNSKNGYYRMVQRCLSESQWANNGGVFIPYVPPTKTEIENIKRQKVFCKPLQFRKALRQLGFHSAVMAYIKNLSEEEQEEWRFASIIHRLDPMVLSLQEFFEKTDQQIDRLFRIAKTQKA